MTGPTARRALSAAAAGLIAAGCSTNGMASLPLPAPGVGSGGYLLTAVFSNALNLPAKAKVKLAGADIGQVDSIVARNYTAVTTLRILDSVRVPAGSTVELRSATPLGDVFVSIKPPDPADPDAPSLDSGDIIGLPDTTAAATVESVLSSAAVLVSGGAVRNLTNIVNGLGRATGDQGLALGNLIRQSNQLMGTLNGRAGQIDGALTEIAHLAGELSAKSQTITDLLTTIGPATETLAGNSDQLTNLAMTAGEISGQLARFPSIAGSDTSGRSVLTDLNTIAGSWNDVATSPEINLTDLNRLLPVLVKATSGPALSTRASVDRLILGSIPDAGFGGDSGLHGPKWADFQQLIGSLKYTLWRLQERVVGQGPDSAMGGPRR